MKKLNLPPLLIVLNGIEIFNVRSSDARLQLLIVLNGIEMSSELACAKESEIF